MQKAVIFDLDGVIFNTEDCWKVGFEIITKKYGLPLDENYRITICGKSEAKIIEELNIMFPTLDAVTYRKEIAYEYVNQIEKGNYHLKEGFFELINELKKKDYKIALATSNLRWRMEKIFSNKGIDPYKIFDVIITVSEIGNRTKPDPYIFLKASEELGADPKQTMVIEDSLNGIEAAVRGNFIPVMDIDLIPPNEYAKKHCYKIVDSLLEVIPLVN
ncbi:MAG: HAD family phosphatase [Erysipelotrichaceae bacterium]|jgi:HAD superfamily hydrolase (TIGR01509 family)|nr:HAD family phosphatase [Erysipelotrichaceae bacterium]